MKAGGPASWLLRFRSIHHHCCHVRRFRAQGWRVGDCGLKTARLELSSSNLVRGLKAHEIARHRGLMRMLVVRIEQRNITETIAIGC